MTNSTTVSQNVQQAIVGAIAVSALSIEELVSACEALNAAYRTGSPLVSDSRYDQDFAGELRRRDPQHPFLTTPEPEPDGTFGERYRHSVPMLSTDKAYTTAEVDAWVKRVIATAEEIGVAPGTLTVRVTPKLDGIAIYDYGTDLVTRGRNCWGQRVSGILEKGVQIIGDVRAIGAGELVIEQAFFDDELAEQYDLSHPRNFIAGLVGADDLSDYHRKALDAKMVRLVPYSTLAGINLPLLDFAAAWESAMQQAQQVPYLCDGAVAEITDARVKAQMGATSHHHKWMVALKRNDVEAETVVESVRLTTGRTGRITPTLVVMPVNLYGVTITHATAHTGKHLSSLGLGAGAKVVLTRAGGVIPKVLRVTEPVSEALDLSKCPSCGGATEWSGPYLVCPHTATCNVQAERSLGHFMATIGCKGFGPSICEALVKAGAVTIRQVYGLDAAGFAAAGISPGVAKNLLAELERSRKDPLSDAIFLGAFGIRHLGRGDSRKVLQRMAIETLGTLTVERLQQIDGFGDGTSGPIVSELQRSWPLIQSMLDLGFNLEASAQAAQNAGGVLAGKTIVFTGTMTSGSRSDMEAGARQLGATVGSSVTGKTTYLVCGENVGATKTGKAQKLGVQVISEGDYLAMVK